MTISYNLDVSSSSSWTFLRVIFRWRGSVWKSVFQELITWTICYSIGSLVYRYLLAEYQQIQFAALAHYMDERMEYIPLTFLLGFFVTIVVDRWKNIFANIGFVDNVAFYIANYVIGNDDETRIAKRNIVRYLCLTQVLVLRDISIKVRKRFPNLDAVVDAGFMQPHEKEIMDKIDNDFSKYWVPINWIFAICVDLRLKGKIAADVLLNGVLNEVKTFHINLRTLCNYDWVPVPLAYPQVVFLAVRVYFLICIVSRQYIINDEADNKAKIDLYIPFMTQLQLIFYMGWLKVAEALLNPFGEDDDDLECNYIIDRNITIALSMVDQTSTDIPEQIRDAFHAGDKPFYSEEAADMPVHALVGSAARQGVEHEKEKVKMVPRNNTTDAEATNDSTSSLKFSNSTNLSKRLRDRFSSRKRSQSLSMHGLESGNAQNNFSISHPPAWYDNKQFEYSSSTPVSPVDPVNHHLETVREEDTTSQKSTKSSKST
jgi:predicted membrane chloride channel (bestrophin family)